MYREDRRSRTILRQPVDCDRCKGRDARTLVLDGRSRGTPTFKLDEQNRRLGKGVISAEVNSKVISWYEEGVLRTINRSNYTVFRQLADRSFFRRSGRSNCRRGDDGSFKRCSLPQDRGCGAQLA